MFLCLWDSPGKNTGLVWHSLLQGILLMQRLNPGLQYCRQILYHLSHQGALTYTTVHYVHHLPEFAQSRVHQGGDAIQPSHPLLPPLFLPSIFPNIRVFSSESALSITCPRYWSFSFSISPSNGYSGLSSLRIVWFDLLAVQGTLKRVLQHHSLKESILRCS